MKIEKWKEVIGQIKDNFSVEDHGHEKLDDDAGTEVEYIVFQSPLGKTKLELFSKPLLLETKTNYSKRLGSDVSVENIYSEEEKVHNMKAYKWEEDAEDWMEIEAKNFEL